MKLLAFPALHICQCCGDELATDGKPCTDCQWEREQFVRAARRLGVVEDYERRRKKGQFTAYTVLVCLVAFGVLSAIGWMLK